MDMQRIGDAAGLVWQKLRDCEDGCSVTELKKVIGFTQDEVVAGLGWLAREGKVNIEASGKRTQVTLVETEMFV